jgi:hypothetical protein
MKVMLDLETLSSKSNAAIVAIGAVTFGSGRETAELKFYRAIKPESAEKAGLHISASTFAWWCQQSDAARTLFTDKTAVQLADALRDFGAYCRCLPMTELWGNGSDFDNVILGAAYDAIDMYRPWKHSQNRCYRTLKSLVSPERANALWEKHASGTHHNALDDAVRQANIAVEIFEELKNEQRQLDIFLHRTS